MYTNHYLSIKFQINIIKNQMKNGCGMMTKKPFLNKATTIGAKVVKAVYFDAPKAAYKRGKR